MPRGGAREGAGRPTYSATGEKAKQFSVKLPPEVIEEIKAKAEAEGVSQAKLIALAVAAYQLTNRD